MLFLLFIIPIFSVLSWPTACAQESSNKLGSLSSPIGGIAFNDTDLVLEMVREGLEAKQYKQAAKLCDSIIQRDKTNKEAHFLSGIAHHYLGEHDLAVEELSWVLLLDKDNSIAKEYLEKSKRKITSQWALQETRLVKTAMQYHKEELHGLAIGTLKGVLGQNPQNTEAWELLGDIYKKLGNRTIAKAIYHRANAQEKAKEIEGEVKYIPKEWGGTLSVSEAKLYEANSRFVEIRNQTIQLGGRLSEFDKRASETLDFEAKQLEEKITSTKAWQEKLQGTPSKPEQQHVSSDILTPEAKLKQRPLLDYEIRTSEEVNLLGLQSAYNEERSKMSEELEEKIKEFHEVKSSMDNLEEDLSHSTL